jgi:hypothetical protein
VKLKGEGGARGRVWGVLHWRGRPPPAAPGAPGPAPRRVPGAAKRVWRWLPPDEERARLVPLAARLRELEGQQQQQQGAAAGGSE